MGGPTDTIAPDIRALMDAVNPRVVVPPHGELPQVTLHAPTLAVLAETVFCHLKDDAKSVGEMIHKHLAVRVNVLRATMPGLPEANAVRIAQYLAEDEQADHPLLPAAWELCNLPPRLIRPPDGEDEDEPEGGDADGEEYFPVRPTK